MSATVGGFAPAPSRGEVEAYALRVVEDCTRTLNEEMGSVLCNPVDSLLGDPWWSVRVKLSWSPHRGRSCGGVDKYLRPYISIAMRRVIRDRMLQEYKSFWYDPEIGSMHTGWKGIVAGVVAHEMAHAAGWTMIYKTKKTRAGFNLCEFHQHGDGWKAIYCLLRKRHVNHLGTPVARPKVDLLSAIAPF